MRGFVDDSNQKRGTVKIRCGDGMNLMAFAESGDLKKFGSMAEKDDEISYNGLLSSDRTIHLERLKILSSTPDRVVQNVKIAVLL